jgi:hypothetical protein
LKNSLKVPRAWATQEAEVRKITVQSQPRKIVHETLSQKNPITEKSWWSGSRSRPLVQIPVPPKKKV